MSLPGEDNAINSLELSNHGLIGRLAEFSVHVDGLGVLEALEVVEARTSDDSDL